MADSSEELIYWYLRLNGFFPLRNFVIHRSQKIRYPSDIDILAVRFPYVFEEVGGQADDWDNSLFDLFDRTLPIGLICEVKSGRVNIQKIFKPENISYAVGRFGFEEYPNTLSELVSQNPLYKKSGKFQISKILFSYNRRIESDIFFHISINHVRDFLQNRIRKYQRKKVQDRKFFHSELIQDLIEASMHIRRDDFNDTS